MGEEEFMEVAVTHVLRVLRVREQEFAKKDSDQSDWTKMGRRTAGMCLRKGTSRLAEEVSGADEGCWTGRDPSVGAVRPSVVDGATKRECTKIT